MHVWKVTLSWNVCFVLQDECSYVSLRDIERFMIVYKWFFEMYEELSNVKWNSNVRNSYCMYIMLLFMHSNSWHSLLITLCTNCSHLMIAPWP